MASFRLGLSVTTTLVLASCAAAAPPPPSAEPGTPVDRPYVYEVPPGSPGSEARDTLSTLQVSGNAEVQVEADRARLVFAVETEAESASRASELNAERMEAVLSALREMEVDDMEIETRGYSLQPRYRRPGDGGTREIDGYRATNQVVVTVPDLTRVGDVIDAAVGAGANRVSSLTFEASDTEEARLDALERAVARARRQAETIAGAMGVELGAVLEVTGGADPVRPFPEFREEAMAMADATTPIEPGAQTVSASVTVRYVLEGTGR